jgi:hypothetical protein
MESAVLHTQRDDTSACAVLIHDQVCGEVLDKEHGVVPKGLRTNPRGQACASQTFQATQPVIKRFDQPVRRGCEA